MCKKPIWVADDLPAAAVAAGWQAADWEWEKQQEQAATAALAGDLATAAECWHAGLCLAQEHFAADDPRLGTSLANVGFCRQRAGDDGSDYLAAAKRVWDVSPAWIDRIPIEQRARSSVHHFRMEAKNRHAYQAQARRQLQDMAATVRACLAGDNTTAAAERLRQWEKEKPPVFGERRKLIAACLLLVTNYMIQSKSPSY